MIYALKDNNTLFFSALSNFFAIFFVILIIFCYFCTRNKFLIAKTSPRLAR